MAVHTFPKRVYVTTATEVHARFLSWNRGKHSSALVFLFCIIMPSCFCNYSPIWLLQLSIFGTSASQLNTSGISSAGTKHASGSASKWCSSTQEQQRHIACLLPYALPWQFYYPFPQKASSLFGAGPPASSSYSVVHLVFLSSLSKHLLQRLLG